MGTNEHKLSAAPHHRRAGAGAGVELLDICGTKSSGPLKKHEKISSKSYNLTEWDKVMWLCGVVASNVSYLEGQFRQLLRLLPDNNHQKNIDRMNIGKISETLPKWLKKIETIPKAHKERFDVLCNLAQKWGNDEGNRIRDFRKDLLHQGYIRHESGKALSFDKGEWPEQIELPRGFERRNFDTLYAEYEEIHTYIKRGCDLHLILKLFLIYTTHAPEDTLGGAVISLFEMDQFTQLYNSLLPNHAAEGRHPDPALRRGGERGIE